MKERPVVGDGKVVACPTFNLILNFVGESWPGSRGRFFARLKGIWRILTS